MLIRIKMIRSSTKMTAEYSASQTFYCIYNRVSCLLCQLYLQLNECVYTKNSLHPECISDLVSPPSLLCHLMVSVCWAFISAHSFLPCAFLLLVIWTANPTAAMERVRGAFNNLVSDCKFFSPPFSYFFPATNAQFILCRPASLQLKSESYSRFNLQPQVEGETHMEAKMSDDVTDDVTQVESQAGAATRFEQTSSDHNKRNICYLSLGMLLVFLLGRWHDSFHHWCWNHV